MARSFIARVGRRFLAAAVLLAAAGAGTPALFAQAPAVPTADGELRDRVERQYEVLPLRDGVLPPSAERYEVMYSEVRHLTHLVEDLRTLSLADAGELSMQPQAVQPRLLLEQTAAAFQHQAAQQQVRLRMEVEEPLPEIWADPARMEQVLDNLVSNALHHTPAEGEIVLSARAAEGGVELRVRDSGAGMDAQTLPQIFERFYRADSARQNSASGLGLAITKSLVELHGGRIGAESPGLGQGSTFMVWMPARL